MPVQRRRKPRRRKPGEGPKRFVGRKASLPAVKDRNGEIRLTVNVRIVDGRTVWGRDEVLVEPLYGSGQAWVAVSALEISDTDIDRWV